MDLNLFFPIAGLTFNTLTILAVGFMGGLVSSGLGIGSGVVVTPALLVILGVPPLVAVTSQMGNAVGVNLIGFLGYWRRRDVDFSLGIYLFLGGLLGAFAEIILLKWLNHGSVHHRIALIYVVVLTSLGTLLLVQNLRAFIRPTPTDKSVMMRYWMIYFPWHKIFIRSRTEISILVPILVGLGTGLLTSTLGGGNSLFMLPILSYLIGRVTPVVPGTTLFAGFMITTVVTIIHSFAQSPFDLLLVFFLLIGGIVGSKIGVRLSYHFPRHYLGLVGAFVIYLISAKFAFDIWGVSYKGQPLVSSSHALVQGSEVFSNVSWTHIFSDFLQQTLVGYVSLGILSIILMAILLEKLLQKAITLFYRQ